MTTIYKIAERNIRVTSLHAYVHRLCGAYQTDETAVDFSVSVTQADIDFEREKSAQEQHPDTGLCTAPDDYLETLAVYRQIAEQMPRYDTVLIHGSCVAVDGIGYLFVAPSGTGKSTHTRLWRERFSERAVMINDDKPLVRVTETGAVIYGTPWDGKHRLSTNTAVPLKAICRLERGDENRIAPMTAKEAYPTFLQQVYRPADVAATEQTLTLIDRLITRVGLWRLSCNMDPEAALVAYDAMKG